MLYGSTAVFGLRLCFFEERIKNNRRVEFSSWQSNLLFIFLP
ncbi:hypothetical protein VT98_11053 [Candidatus Electrothrix communis]|uniref:Uncharacterized protein n=1 Tax=Candidatus Electrothrix communis TaxID=1859133 RepID=A0A3S3RBK0_9BACT|nr:hypothetical protein VT98_11053 [Candidatus Electrothrix communis]